MMITNIAGNELSMSMISEFLESRRKWYYHYVVGLESKQTPDYIWIGTGFHKSVAGAFDVGYADPEEFLRLAHACFDAWLTGDDAKGFPLEQAPLVHDMIEYWWRNDGAARAMAYAGILAVEEHIPLSIGKYTIRCTPDLVVRKTNGKITIPDHKTKGKIDDSLSYLSMDLQLRCYALTVWDKYGEVPEVDYNMIRRELPPDYVRTWDGTLSTPYGLTKTGRKSTRSCEVSDYLRYERQVFTEKQLMAFAAYLEGVIDDMYQALEQKRFICSCATSKWQCPYQACCQREMDGEKLDGITLSLEFNRREKQAEAA